MYNYMQMVRNFRKPLIVLSPKTLIRLPVSRIVRSSLVSHDTSLHIRTSQYIFYGKITYTAQYSWYDVFLYHHSFD